MHGQDGELMRGTGQPLGACATAFARPDRTLTHLLAARAATRPDDTWLIVDGIDSITYGQAQAASERVADAISVNCAPGGRVAIVASNSVEFVFALLGALRAHCVAVPLHARARGSYLDAMLASCRPDVVVTSAESAAALADCASLADVGQIVCLPSESPIDRPWPEPIAERVTTWNNWLAAGGQAPTRPPSSHQPALLQYTSGTTGHPKGALYSNHYLYMYSALSADAHGHRPDDVLTTPLPMYHAAALHHVAMGALHAGAVGHLKSRFSASQFWQQAKADGATFAVLMGPLAEMLRTRTEPTRDHEVARVFCTPPPIDRAGFERDYGVRVLWQTYGMTEIYAAPMMDRVDDDDSPNAVGRPGTWTDFGVMDEDGELLPAGTTGELVFRPRLPRMMADEYFGLPSETVLAFRGLVFHTGDLGYYDDDGRLYFVSRTADRIRRRGENISATEIERSALAFTGVIEAAAFGISAELGDDEIKLDVVPDSVDLSALHEHLRSTLPAFMVPRYYESRARFPRTPSERIRKNELRDLGVRRDPVLDVERADGSR